MRVVAVLLLLACFGCSDHPTPQEDAVMRQAQTAIRLPEGGGSLACYERHYTLLRGAALEARIGASPTGVLRQGILLGSFVRPGDTRSIVGKPGAYWAKSVRDLPHVEDAGCGILTVWYVIGAPNESVSATCGVTGDGMIPTRIDPPVVCNMPDRVR